MRKRRNSETDCSRKPRDNNWKDPPMRRASSFSRWGALHLAATEPPQEATQQDCTASSVAGNSCPQEPRRCPRLPSRHPSELNRCIGLQSDSPLVSRIPAPPPAIADKVPNTCLLLHFLICEAWEDEENNKCPVSQQQSHSQMLEYRGAQSPECSQSPAGPSPSSPQSLAAEQSLP